MFLCLVLTVMASFVWLGHPGETLAQGQTTFTENSFRVDNEGVSLSQRGGNSYVLPSKRLTPLSALEMHEVDQKHSTKKERLLIATHTGIEFQ